MPLELAEVEAERGKPLGAGRIILLAILAGGLFITSDWRGEIWLGRRPESTMPLSSRPQDMRFSTSLMADDEARSDVSEGGFRATGTKDGSLTIERMNGGPELQIPSSVVAPPMFDVVRFSYAAQMLAIVENNRMYTGSLISIWTVAPGSANVPPALALKHRLAGHPHWTFSLDFFPDDRTLVSSNGDGTVSLWDLQTGKELSPSAAQKNSNGWDVYVECVAASPDGESFATWGSDNELRIWDRSSRHLLHTFSTGNDIPSSLGFSPDGRHIIAIGRQEIATFSIHPNPIPLFLCLTATALLLAWAVRKSGHTIVSQPHDAVRI